MEKSGGKHGVLPILYAEIRVSFERSQMTRTVNTMKVPSEVTIPQRKPDKVKGVPCSSFCGGSLPSPNTTYRAVMASCATILQDGTSL